MKEKIINILKSPISWYIIILLVLTGIIIFQSRQINKLQQSVIDVKLQNNKEIIQKFEELSKTRQDTIIFYTNKINNYYHKNDSIYKEIDKIQSGDSLISMYYLLRPRN